MNAPRHASRIRADARPRIVVVGAGIGGLTTAAILARAGIEVTVLEAHIYPGGCAGTFYHQGYRFDAGATLAGGFYAGGPMDQVAQAAGVRSWPAQGAEPAMVVHLPGGQAVTRWGDARRWEERTEAFGSESRRFWEWQERTADALWSFALRNPPWPPQRTGEAFSLGVEALRWALRDVGPAEILRRSPALAADLVRPVAAHLRGLPESLRVFTDAQLLIASQATSAETNALYGASALDLPRRGVVHFRGGMGAIAETLAQSVRNNGGSIVYRQEVRRILMERGRPVDVETKRGERFMADTVVANLTPWNLARVLGNDAPRRLRRLPAQPKSGGGAFMVYAGVDSSLVPAGSALHHQVIAREPMGEGNTVFLSLSPEWDGGRAPSGMRAVTISTHTALPPWWELFERDRHAYEARKSLYAERLLAAAERALPGIREAAGLVLPANPVTFQRFTRREWGWVGGFPQTDLFRAWAPRIAPNLWMVGDTIFPGQSTAAVVLGGMRVARAVLGEYGREDVVHTSPAPHATH